MPTPAPPMVRTPQSEAISPNEELIDWRTINIIEANLFTDDKYKSLEIELYTDSPEQIHKPLDKKLFTFDDLRNNLKWNSSIGLVEFLNLQVEKTPPFMDYLFNNLEINLSIAIDFTSSNGIIKMPSSLHYINSDTNQYMKTIKSIGSILQEYTSEKNIPVFGFGSRLPNLDGIYNCFALNGNIFSPGLYTINKVLEAYKKNTKKLQFI